MFAELLGKLEQLISKAESPKVIPTGDHRKSVVSVNGSIQSFDVPAGIREHEITRIEDFIAAANRWGKDKGVIFHNHERIELVVDDEDRRDRVYMDLEKSQTFQFLSTLNGSSMDHKAFVSCLKTILLGKVHDGLLPLVRKLEAATGTRTMSEMQHGRERGTKEFQAELIGTSELPEIIAVLTPVYANAGLQKAQSIKCTLDVEIPSLAVRLCPLPDEITTAIQMAQANINDILSAEVDGIQVFHGSP